MVGNRLTIKLTADQQKQFREATGRNVAELHLDLGAAGELSESELDRVSAGSGGDRPTESISLNFTKIIF